MEYTSPMKEDLKHLIVNDYLRYDYFSFPYMKGITSTSFIPQHVEKLNTMIPLWCMDQKNRIKRRLVFKIRRWDIEYPYKVILTNDANNITLVTKAEFVEEDGKGEMDGIDPVANAYVHLYPLQNYSVIGVRTIDRYMCDLDSNCGIIIRADSVENCGRSEVVIFEELTDTSYRVVTLDETKATCQYGDVVEHDETIRNFITAWKETVGRY